MRKLKNTELNRKSIEEFKKADKTPAIVAVSYTHLTLPTKA